MVRLEIFVQCITNIPIAMAYAQHIEWKPHEQISSYSCFHFTSTDISDFSAYRKNVSIKWMGRILWNIHKIAQTLYKCVDEKLLFSFLLCGIHLVFPTLSPPVKYMYMYINNWTTKTGNNSVKIVTITISLNREFLKFQRNHSELLYFFFTSCILYLWTTTSSISIHLILRILIISCEWTVQQIRQFTIL